MKLTARFSPNQLAAGSMIGAILAYCAAWMTAVPLPRPTGTWHNLASFLWACRIDILLTFAPLLAGGALALLSTSAFERNIRNDLWPQASLSAVRAQLNRPVWTALTCLGTLAGLGYLVFDLVTRLPHAPHHQNPGAFAYFFVIPLLIRSRLRVAVRPPRDAKPREWLHQQLAPLTSSHWGRPPQAPPS